LTATTPAGRQIVVKNNGTGTITLKAVTGEFIDGTAGATGISVAAGTSRRVITTGAASAAANTWITI
jgi:hypothetical protein